MDSGIITDFSADKKINKFSLFIYSFAGGFIALVFLFIVLGEWLCAGVLLLLIAVIAGTFYMFCMRDTNQKPLRSVTKNYVKYVLINLMESKKHLIKSPISDYESFLEKTAWDLFKYLLENDTKGKLYDAIQNYRNQDFRANKSGANIVSINDSGNVEFYKEALKFFYSDIYKSNYH